MFVGGCSFFLNGLGKIGDGIDDPFADVVVKDSDRYEYEEDQDEQEDDFVEFLLQERALVENDLIDDVPFVAEDILAQHEHVAPLPFGRAQDIGCGEQRVDWEDILLDFDGVFECRFFARWVEDVALLGEVERGKDEVDGKIFDLFVGSEDEPQFLAKMLDLTLFVRKSKL